MVFGGCRNKEGDILFIIKHHWHFFKIGRHLFVLWQITKLYLTNDFYSWIRVFYNFTISKVWKLTLKFEKWNLKFFDVRDVCWQADKEKKKKKKKEEAAAPPPEPEPAPAPEPEPAPTPKASTKASSRGSKKSAKRSGSNVFSMFSQGQIAEFKEVSIHRWGLCDFGVVGVSRMHLLNSTDRIPNSRRFTPNIGRTFFFVT